ncbi:hypothetical protein, partial [Streptococcus suis]|uniref:hypothetical protein n=1 Tax=Streptococcus suis TaxID=1307 RepID=UPI001B356BC3
PFFSKNSKKDKHQNDVCLQSETPLGVSYLQPKATRQVGDKPATCIAGFPISRLKQPIRRLF